MASRDEILADFQACTGIEDYGEAFTCLESCNWDLLEAINNALPEQQQRQQQQEDISVINDNPLSLSALSSSTLNSTAETAMEQVDVIDLDDACDDVSNVVMSELCNDEAGTSRSDNDNKSNVASSSSQSSNCHDVININIQILSDGVANGSTFPLELPPSTTVSELKTLLHQLVGIAPCHQILEGFEKPALGETVITRDILPNNMSISLNTSSSSSISSSFNHFSSSSSNSNNRRANGRIMSSSSDNCNLLIHDEKNTKDYSLHYGSSKLVNDIKKDVFLLTGIPVSRQGWTGWPRGGGAAAMDQHSSLCSIGVTRVHHLTVAEKDVVGGGGPQKRTPKTSRKSTATRMIAESGENSSADEEFEDASELLPPEEEVEEEEEEEEVENEVEEDEDFLLMCDVTSSSASSSALQSRQSLIPPDIEDEAVCVLSFVDNFQARFGASSSSSSSSFPLPPSSSSSSSSPPSSSSSSSSCVVPLFFHGTLEMAVKESVMLPAKKRKPLAVYLHHDKSVLSNVFCSQSLCHISVVDFLTNNFLVWGWDLTHESNKARLLNLLSSHFGHAASTAVRNYGLEKLPALLVITRSRGSVEILSVIHGNSVLDEVMTSLMHALEIFEDQRGAEAVEESHREQRETMMAEQDAAYNASLEADRAKAQAKRKAELEEREERQRRQSMKEQEHAIKEAVRASLELELPPEPGPECTEATSTLRFKVPKAETFVRVFTRGTPLQVVLNYLCVKGYSVDEWKYIQAWPRRCISTLDPAKTLGELNFHNQETINIEERCDE